MEPTQQPKNGVKGTNPKDLIGVTKAPLQFIPPSALLAMGEAMEIGAKKYGPFNWRDHPVQAGIYYEAALRHLFAWFDGEDIATDEQTGLSAHHLGHVMACCAIILDAMGTNAIEDTRPIAGQFAALADEIARLRKRKATIAAEAKNPPMPFVGELAGAK